jgi:hypothetical protein
MGINLELIAARAEAMAAEEAVLWDLTVRLMGVLSDVTAVSGVGWGLAQGRWGRMSAVASTRIRSSLDHLAAHFSTQLTTRQSPQRPAVHPPARPRRRPSNLAPVPLTSAFAPLPSEQSALTR